MKNIYSLTHLGALVVCLFLCFTVKLNAQCAATNIPYAEDFASAAPPSFPVCTSMQNSGPGASWVTYDFASDPMNGITTKALAYFSDHSSIPNTWFYTKGLNLTAGTFYRLTYNYVAFQAFYSENMKVSYGTSATASAMTATLTNHFHFSNDFVLTQTVDFTPATTGVYYIGFNAYSDTYASFGIFVDDIAVDLSPSCVQLGTVNLASLNATNAMINWPVGTPAGSWDVYYGPSPLTAPSSSTAPTATTTTASYSLTGLTPSTVYDVYVRTYCSATDQSSWTSVSSFTTPCVPTSIPYTEDFESALIPSFPACTSVQNLGGGNSWKTGTSVTAGFGSKALRYQFNDFNPADTWFYTQGLNLTGGVSYRFTYRYGNSGGSSYPERLNVNYGSSAMASAMTHTLTNHFDFVNNYSITETVDFIPAATGVYYIGFHAYSNATMKNIYVDDIMVDLSPTCFELTSVNLIGLGANNASLNWTGGSVSASWDVYYGTSPLALPTATTAPTATTTTASYTINGLSANTGYDAYVRAHCSATDQSLWVPVSFTTTCLPVTVLPFTEGFESVTTPAVPSCWTVIDGNNDGDQWNTQNSTTYAHTGSKMVSLNTNGHGGNNNDWLITPNIILNGNQRLTYWVRIRDSFEPNDYTVKLSTSGPVMSAFTHTLLGVTMVSNTTYVQKVINLSAYSGSTVAIAFQVPAGGLDGYYIYLDDITIEDVPVCNPPAALTVSNTTVTTTTLSWTIPSAGTPANYIYEVRTTGAAGSGALGLVSSGTVAVPTNSVQVSGLNPGTTYNAYIRSDCGLGNFSIWSLASTFTTSTCSITVSAVSSQSIVCVGESAVLTASASSTASYTWSANAGSATTASVSVSPTVTTVYTLTAVNGACTVTSTVSIIVDCTVGVEELNAASITLMPNPNNGQVIISLPGTLSGNTFLEIYDAIGKLVMKHPLSASDNVIITAPLEKGLYLYRIYNNKHVIKTGKMIRE